MLNLRGPRSTLFKLLFVCFSITSNCYAQGIGDVILGHNPVGEDFSSFASRIEEKYGLEFKYLPVWTSDLRLEKDFANEKLIDAINEILLDTDISFSIFYEHYVVLYKNPSADIEKEKIRQFLAETQNPNQKVIGNPDQFVLGKKVVVTGRVTDIATEEPIIGAAIRVRELNIGAITNASGYYKIQVDPGKYELVVENVNYQAEVIPINIVSDGRFDIQMFESSVTLDDVLVYSKAENSNVVSTQVGTEQLSIEAIKELPTFLGEVDVIKSIQLLPGVTSVGEGATGFNVRGGSIDQNLVMLEGTQVFNYSHLLGFFSAFNPSTVKSIELTRGGIPAQYGQRLSSILDVKMKDGNKENFAANGGIGMVSSHLMIEGPLVKDKSSFFVAGRSSYSDWILDRVNDVNVRNSSASFYDVTGRVAHNLNDNNRLTVNAYLSRDEFNLANDTTYNWSSVLLSSRFSHIFDPTFVGNLNIGYGSYEYGVEEPDESIAFLLKFNIQYQQIDLNFEKVLGNQKISFGVASNYYQVKPGSIEPNSERSNINPFSVDEERALESGIYLSDEFKFGGNLSIIAGLRFSHFMSLGPSSVFTFEEDQPRELDNVTDTLLFANNETIQTYYGFEPRLSMRYLVSPRSSIKFGYNRINQYIHLVSNTTAATPIDIWQLSGYHIRPQVGDQISLGYFLNSFDNKYEFSSEVYFKKIDNILEYKDGAELTLNPNLEVDLVQGEGRSYGVEVMLKKVKGRLTGWGSYTYSRSEHKVASPFIEEEINNGRFFPSNYNKPHDFTLVGNYRFSLRFAFNFNFTYSTGRPITAPISKYDIDGVIINNYSERNAYNIPDYHRLDIGFTINTNHKKDKFWEGYWNVSVYNVYGRRNAYSVYFEDTPDGRPQAKKLSVLGAPFPAISYIFKI